MEIVAQHPARLEGEHLGTSIVIDVLRATTTATVLCARGASRMFAVETPADLPSAMSGGDAGYLVVSELDAVESGPNRIDNSPVTALGVELAGRVPILVTTNGTRALAAAAGRSDVVLLASFLNLRCVADHLLRSAPQRITLLPAGKFADATARIEDDLCAELLHRALTGRDLGSAEAFGRIREDASVQRRLQKHLSFAADLDLSLSLDRYQVIPFVQGGGASGGSCLIRPL